MTPKAHPDKAGHYSHPILYCSSPKCHEGADYLIPFGDECLLACNGHYHMLIRSFPSKEASTNRIDPFASLPAPWNNEPIKQQKTVYLGDKKWSWFAIVGGKRK